MGRFSGSDTLLDFIALKCGSIIEQGKQQVIRKAVGF